MKKLPIKIGIVDDHRPTLMNLVKLLGYDSNLEIIFYVDSALKFLDQMKHLSPAEYPKVILTDIDMPEMSGIDMVLIGKGKYPNVNFLMLTVYDDEEVLFNAIKAGANGYLLKDEKVSVIVDHIQSLVYEGGAPMSPSIAKKTLGLLKSPKRNESNTSINTPKLSKRELEVLSLLVDGKNYKEIAPTLFISNNTVKKHMKNIYVRLHVSSKAQAIKMSNFYGLV